MRGSVHAAVRTSLAALLTITAAVWPVAKAGAVIACGAQFGTGSFDRAAAIATDGTSVWIGGTTFAGMSGQPYKGNGDAFVTKFDSTCAPLWTREFGTAGYDTTNGLARDGSGNVYVVGKAEGKLKGGSWAGSWDAFVRAYDANGNLLWATEFGTATSDSAQGVVMSGKKLLVVGAAGPLAGQKYAGGSDDAYLRAFRASTGKLLWTREFGSKKYDLAGAVAVHQTTVYIGGYTNGAFKGQTYTGNGDVFVRSYSTAGAAGFTREFGTSQSDGVGGIGADASGVVIAGTTSGSFPSFTNQGVQDGFVRALDTSGNTSWTYEYGTSSEDLIDAMVLNGSFVWLGGSSFGGIGEISPPSTEDVYVATLDRATGTTFSATGFGTSSIDEGGALAPLGGGVLFAGDSYGDMEGTNLGQADAFYTPCCS